MKYEYLLHTWGGFYNKEYDHGETEGFHYFDTKELRDDYLKRLRRIEKELNAKYLMTRESEGYHVRAITTLHRVTKWEGKSYYSKHEMSPSCSFWVAKYHLENKWYPGWNDYPLGEDFDYGKNEVEIIQEWITGAFDITNE